MRKLQDFISADSSLFHPHGIDLLFDVQVVALDINPIDQSLIAIMNESLSISDISRYSYFRDPFSAYNFLAGRYLVRRFISEAYGISPRDVQIIIGENGKPYNTHICFNITHSAGYLVAAFGRGINIGIDVESFRPNINIYDVSRAVFPDQDSNYIATSEKSDYQEFFYQNWTFHEARIKMDGLTIDHIKYHQSAPFRSWQLDFNSSNVYGCLCCRIINRSYENISYRVL